jgi:hopanoid biosynthesis associated protein HpnK
MRTPSLAMRRLIVNGDDFGLTSGVNAGILDAHERGILTSASVFANAPATEEALQIARRTTTLGVGCHLALVDGAPVLPPSRLPSLAPDGLFRPTWRGFITAAVSGRIQLAEIERELTAQIDRVTSVGVQPTHLDSHKHVHAYPPVFEIVARLARRFGIASVRVPCEPRPWAQAVRFAGTRGARRQALENLALAPWAGVDRRLLARMGLPPVHFWGRALTGLMTPTALYAGLRALPQGTSELMLHPGYADAALQQVRTRLRQARETELEILTDPATREVVAALGIVLTRHGLVSEVSRVQAHVS